MTSASISNDPGFALDRFEPLVVAAMQSLCNKYTRPCEPLHRRLVA